MELKMQEINSKNSQKEDARGPGAWASRPRDGALLTHPLSDYFSY